MREPGVWRGLLLLLLACGLSGLACQAYVNEVPGRDGGDGDAGGDPDPLTVCDQVSEMVAGWMDDRCAEWRGCCFCECWLDGHRVVDNFDPCVCGGSNDPLPAPRPAPGALCEGDQREVAEQCLADEEACWQGLVQAVDSLCSWD